MMRCPEDHSFHLAGKLAETVRKIDPEFCLTGHSEPLSPEQIVRDLLEGE